MRMRWSISRPVQQAKPIKNRYTEVTKTRDEEYEETISKTRLTTVMRPVEKRMKKIEYTPVYDTWAHKWVQREDVSYYNETVTDWKWENVPYTERLKRPDRFHILKRFRPVRGQPIETSPFMTMLKRPWPKVTTDQRLPSV